MRIVEWNSQGAFRKKNDRILSLQADILIISECESESKLKFGRLTPKPSDFVWYGDSENKGIGIFSYSDYKFEVLQIFNPRFRFIVPIKVTSEDSSFLLFGIWAMDNKEKPKERYIGQIWLAINYYSSLLSLPCILAGDFNSNKIWDKKERVGNHTDMVRFLANRAVFSLYHKQEQVEHGEEKHPTFYMYRKHDRPYHIDYFFASNPLIQGGFKMVVGKFENWIDISDHVPLILDINTKIVLDEFDNSLSAFLITKLHALSMETQRRFADVLSVLIDKARKIDNGKSDPNEHEEERKQLIYQCDTMFELDKCMQTLIP